MIRCAARLAVLSLCLAPALPVAVAAEMPRLQSAIDMHLDLHNLLMVATGSDQGAPGFEAEVKDYARARDLIKDPRAWRLINDAILEGPDMATIAARRAQIPSDLSANDREGVRLILGALATAWPRHEEGGMVKRRISLQNTLVKVLRGRFARAYEERVLASLAEKMEIAPLDAPVTVYPVVDAVEVGVAGRTREGYYLVIPVKQRPATMILETLVHEVTHLLDAAQPENRTTLQRRVRAAAGHADPQALEDLLHALVTYNAGELIRRGDASYTPMIDVSPALRDRVAAYRAVLDGAWRDYLDGTIDRDAVVAALVAALPPGMSKVP